MLGDGQLRLSNIYGDNMVFQRSPHRPLVWGWATPGSKVTATVWSPEGYNVTNGEEEAYVGDDEKFEVKIGSYSAGTGFTVTITEVLPTGQLIEAKLTNVAFGEVWLCSGQSNMELRVKDARDGMEEAAAAEIFENVRILKTVRQIATEPQDEALGFYNSWSAPRLEILGSGDSFSAVCLFFGEQLWEELGVPIGLVESDWGGTIVEAWSPPEALADCDVTDSGTDDGHNHNEYLWNAMIHPFLRMSIKGAVWYQGEQNAGYPAADVPSHNKDLYSCTFPAMVDRWRQRWFEATGGDTDPKFPFGFVQLGPFTEQRENLAWPELRWHQTADVGYVPNQYLENVFMAAAMDDDIDLHPKNKRLPATRLAWAASNLAYGMTDKPLAGPLPLSVSFEGRDQATVLVTFTEPLELVAVEEDRFMVCCLPSTEECDAAAYGSGWRGVTILGMSGAAAVQLDTSAACPDYTGLAYLWLETPCSAEATCPLYSASVSRLPVAPFKMAIDL